MTSTIITVNIVQILDRFCLQFSPEIQSLPEEGGIRNLGFVDLAIFGVGFSVFASKICGFSVFLFFFSIRFSIFNQHQGDYSDLVFSAVSGFMQKEHSRKY